MNSFWNRAWQSQDEEDVIGLLEQGLAGPRFARDGAPEVSDRRLGLNMWGANAGTPVSPPPPPMFAKREPPPQAKAPIPEFAPPPAAPVMPMGAAEMHEMQAESDAKSAGVRVDPRLKELRRLYGLKMMADAAKNLSPKEQPMMQFNHPQPGVIQPRQQAPLQTIDPITLALAGFRGY